MSSQETLISKKRRGPAPTGQGTPVMVRLQPSTLHLLDAWCTRQVPRVSRQDAIRRALKTFLDEEY